MGRHTDCVVRQYWCEACCHCNDRCGSQGSAVSLSPSPNRAISTKGGRVPTPDSGPRPRARKARDRGESGAGLPAQTPLTLYLPLPPSQNPSTPQQTSAWLALWTPPIFPVDLPLKDIYSLREEILVAGRLTYFLPFWEEVIQADRWVLEVIHHGYSIELLPSGPEHTNPPRRTTGPIQRDNGPPMEGCSSTSSST